MVSAPMSFQMALDEILFRQIEHKLESAEHRKPLLRFYFSSEPWVTLGYFSKLTDTPFAMPACRRLTGGGRVLHGNDFIFSLIAHKSDDVSFGSVQESYLKIHEAVKAAFETMGYNPQFHSLRATHRVAPTAECFINPIESDLKLAGKKVAGGAQKRSSGVLLHHESIQVPEGVSIKQLYHALQKSFERRFGIAFENASWDPGILSRAKELSANEYVPGKVK